MDLTPDNVAEEQHKLWLKYPSTVQLLINLEKFKLTFADNAMSKSGDHTVSNEFFRNQLYGYRTVESVIQNIKSTTKFLEQAKK